jgi:hypothetical protein
MEVISTKMIDSKFYNKKVGTLILDKDIEARYLQYTEL